MQSIYINDLPLPVALVEAIDKGVWRLPADRSVWTALFPEDEIVQPSLYNFSRAHGMADHWLLEAGAPYFGRAFEGIFPGDIDPTKTILIGDLGPDRLIALYYRESLTNPRVIGLTGDDSYWRVVALNIEEFMRAIRMIE